MNYKIICVMTYIMFLFGSLVPPAQAASFDCEKAVTKVEKLICGNSELSKLDEELSASYKTALQDEKQADSIKQAQKQWMKERNSCDDAACASQAYKDRLKTLGISDRSIDSGKSRVAVTLAQAGMTNSAAQEIPQKSPKLRYAFCDRSSPTLYCEGQTGKGYSVCEDYLKYLQTLDTPPTCEAPIPPGFKLPDWEEIDATQHLDLAYQAEGLFLKKFGGYKQPNFDTWEKTFLQQIKEGKINPRMRKAKVTPNDIGDATILAYTRDRDACHKSYVSEDRRKANYGDLPGLYWQFQGDAHFILTNDTLSALQPIVGDVSRLQTDLLVFAGRPFLVQIERPFDPLTRHRDIRSIIPRDRSPITIYAFDPRFPDRIRLNLDLNHYMADRLCQFKPY
jgi:uncharacterized protein